MNYKKLKLLILSLLISFHFSIGFAQKVSFDKILTIKLKNMGEIMQEDKVAGYYMFYETESIDRKKSAYLLRILDANLKEIGKKNIVASKSTYLLESAYNGKSLFFKFYDAEENMFKFHQYDKTAKLKFNSSRKLEPLDLANVKQAITTDEAVNLSLQAIPSKGFVEYGTKKNKEMGYVIRFFPEEKGQKTWSYQSPAKSEDLEIAHYLTLVNNVLLSSTFKKTSLFSNNADSYILGIDVNTGKKLFEKSFEDEIYKHRFISAYALDTTKNITLFGHYFDKKDSELKDPSLGFCSFTIDNQGNVISKNYISWANDVSKFLSVNAKGKIDGSGFIFFHKIFKADGKIFAIGEQYRKSASAAGLLGGSFSKIVVEDFLVFEFDTDFKLKNVKIFDKNKTNVSLPSGAIYAGSQVLSLFTKVFGGFDYSFTQTKNDNSSFIIGYKDEDGGDWDFKAIIYADNQFTTDKLSLKTSASSLEVYAAKTGYILVTEYFKKQKKLEMRLEKINY